MNVGFISLGCSKNLVDTEVMLGILAKNNIEITAEPAKADILIVNTSDGKFTYQIQGMKIVDKDDKTVTYIWHTKEEAGSLFIERSSQTSENFVDCTEQ